MIITNIENDETVDPCGTSLQGYVKCTYTELVEKFGEPTIRNGDKTNVEWWLEFRVADSVDDFDYVTATIYDWKEPSLPYGKHPWHIGATDWRGVECVHHIMGMGVNENV